MKTIQDARKAFDALKRVYVLTGSQVAQTLDSFLSRLESKIPQTWLGVSNDDEGFILDNAMQHGFEMLDDDGDLFIVPAPELIHYTRVQREDAERQRDCLAAMREALEGFRGAMANVSEAVDDYYNEKSATRLDFFSALAAIDAQLNAQAVDQVADAGKAMCSDGGQCGIGGYCDNCKTGAAKPSPSDTDRLNLLAGLYEIHGGYDYDDGYYVLHQVTGNINDREYEVIGKGVGLREAIDNAKKAGTV